MLIKALVENFLILMRIARLWKNNLPHVIYTKEMSFIQYNMERIS